MHRRSSNREKGFSLIELMVVAAVIGILASLSATLFITMQKQQAQANLTFQAALIRDNMLSIIRDQPSWNLTLAYNSGGLGSNNMLCLKNVTSCPASGWVHLGLLAGPGSTNPAPAGEPAAVSAAAFDFMTASTGFTPTGTVCTGFNTVQGSGTDACPLGYVAQWNSNCGAAPCAGILPSVWIQAYYNPRTTQQRVNFNPAHYSVGPITVGATPAEACWVVSGTNLYENCETKVGLGTTAPDATVTVTENAGFQAAPSGSVVHAAGKNGQPSFIVLDGYLNSVAVPGPQILLRSAEGLGGSPTVVNANDPLGSIGFTGWNGASYPSTTTNDVAHISVFADQNFTGGANGTYMTFATTADGAVAPTQNMILTAAGKVGIGTNSPAERLDVGGGNVKMGYEVNSGTFGGTTGTLNCTAGKQVLGGGCSCVNLANYIRVSSPNVTFTGWTCQCDPPGSTNSIWAICANIK